MVLYYAYVVFNHLDQKYLATVLDQHLVAIRHRGWMRYVYLLGWFRLFLCGLVIHPVFWQVS